MSRNAAKKKIAKLVAGVPETNPKDETFSFDLELTFVSEVEASSDVLLTTIIEAICLYDSRNRLLPGTPMPRGGERLVS